MSSSRVPFPGAEGARLRVGDPAARRQCSCLRNIFVASRPVERSGPARRVLSRTPGLLSNTWPLSYGDEGPRLVARPSAISTALERGDDEIRAAELQLQQQLNGRLTFRRCGRSVRSS